MFAGGTDGSSGSRRHRALAEGILASLLKLLDLALKLRDQFVVAVNLLDQLTYPGVGVGELRVGRRLPNRIVDARRQQIGRGDAEYRS